MVLASARRLPARRSSLRCFMVLGAGCQVMGVGRWVLGVGVKQVIPTPDTRDPSPISRIRRPGASVAGRANELQHLTSRLRNASTRAEDGLHPGLLEERVVTR